MSLRSRINGQLTEEVWVTVYHSPQYFGIPWVKFSSLTSACQVKAFSIFIISKHTFLHLSDSALVIQYTFAVWNQTMMKSLNSHSMKIFCLKNTQNLIGTKTPAAGLQFEAVSLRHSWNSRNQRDTSKSSSSYRNVSRLLRFGRQWKAPTWVQPSLTNIICCCHICHLDLQIAKEHK